MVTLPASAWRSKPGLTAIIAALGGPDEARLVGGAVRDGLLGRPVSDIDVATRHPPTAVIAALEAAAIKAVPTGIAHGTVTAIAQGVIVEVTTLRRDVATDGRHATVAFGSDWQEDAARRDFTINALYADPVTGAVFDWFGGVADLHSGRVRFIGEPLTRIAEDHLRILRFFRFHARFGRGDPDAAGLHACVVRANDLMALSRERIASEFLKLLAAEDPVPVVELMIARGVLAPVLPELGDVAAVTRLVGREAAFGIAGDPVRRLAALIGPDGRLALAIAHRLKLSKATTKRLVTAADRAIAAPKVLAYRLGVEGAIDRLLLADGSPGDFEGLAGWRRPVLPITGGTLIARCLAPGPLVARTLAAIEDAWVARGFPVGEDFESIVGDALKAAS